MKSRSQRRHPHDSNRSLVGFVVADSHYAVSIAGVKQIVQPSTVSPLINAGRGVVGYADHRGDVVRVIDLRAFFGCERAGKDVRPKWIILDAARYGSENAAAQTPKLVGLVVDRVTEVFGTVGATPLDATAAKVEQRGISGVLNRGGSLVFMLDVTQFAEPPEPQVVSSPEPSELDPDPGAAS